MKRAAFVPSSRLRHLLVVCAVTALALAAPDARAAATGLLYALDEDSSAAGSHIYGYSVNEVTGALTALSGFPVATGGLGAVGFFSPRMVVDQANGRLFALNSASNTVSAFAINTVTGALTALPYSPINLTTGSSPDTLAVHPSGSPLIVGNTTSLMGFQITANSATPTAGSPYPTGAAASPFTTTFSSDGNFIYTGGNAGTAFAAFSVNAASGVLTALAGSPFESGAAFPEAYAGDQSGRLFLTNFASGTVRVYTTAAGVPTAVTGSPFNISGLTGAIAGVLHPSGFYMVADRANSCVGVYSIGNSGSATTMTTVAGSPFASGGTTTESLALNHAGTFLYAANGGTRNITSYEVTSTGSLINASTQPTNTLGATGLASTLAYIPPALGSVLYVLNENPTGNQIFAYSLNEGSGQLVPINGFPVSAGGLGDGLSDVERLTIDHVHGRLYALNSVSKTVTAFSINARTGFLSALPFSPIALGGTALPTSIVVHPNGSPLVIGDASDNFISFAITASTATAAAGSPYATGSAQPYSMSFSTNGKYLYAGGAGTTAAAFSVNSGGVLAALPGSPFSTGVSTTIGFATDTAGRVFTADYTGGIVRAFATSAGFPSAVTGNPFSSGLLNTVSHGLVHPGGYYLATSRSNDQVGVFQISGSGSGTVLAAVAGSPFAAGGQGTQSMVFNTGTTLLLVNNSYSGNVTSYLFNSANGALFPLETQPVDATGGAGVNSGMAYTDNDRIFANGFEDP